MPPEFRTASAMDSISTVSASRSIVMLPSSSAVVPRIRPTLIGNAGKYRYSSASISSTRTRSSRVRLFILPPSSRGSMNVPSPTLVIVPGLCAAMSRNRWEITPSGKQYASMLFSIASRPSAGASPQCPPIARRTMPSPAKWFRPRAARSP